MHPARHLSLYLSVSLISLSCLLTRGGGGGGGGGGNSWGGLGGCGPPTFGQQHVFQGFHKVPSEVVLMGAFST